MQMYIGAIFFFLLTFLSESSIAQTIEWMTFSDIEDKMEVEKKKIFVHIYADWCGWCKKMDSTTLQDSSVVKYINEHFYAVKFNGEQKEDIIFKGKTYKYVKRKRNGYNQLAANFTSGRLTYPTVVYLDENLNVIQPIPGFKSSILLRKIMIYFAEDYYRKVPWDKFLKDFGG